MVLILLSLIFFRSPVQLNVALGLRPETAGEPTEKTEPCIWEGECPGGVAVVAAGSSGSRCSFVLVVPVVLAFVPQRNCYIKHAVLFEGDSIVPLPGCLESSGW